jgi:hypothetical protein
MDNLIAMHLSHHHFKAHTHSEWCGWLLSRAEALTG